MAYHPLRAPVNSGVMGYCYLIHLDQPIKHARHYQGWYSNERRLSHHEDGTGANLLRVAKELGITWQVVWVEPGDKNRERQLKNQSGWGVRKRCPICNPNRR